jgi:uncharacterized protein (DUF427 family)
MGVDDPAESLAWTYPDPTPADRLGSHIFQYP